MSEAAAGVDADSNNTTRLDRFLEIVPFAAAAIVVLMIMYWLASRRSTPTIFTDELEWAQLSRAIAATGHAARRGEPTSFKSLYAFLIAPAWWLHSTAAAYTAIKYVNTTVMATAAVPVYLLARRLVSVRAACIAAVGTLCTSAFFYAPLLLPEVLAYPTFCLCAYVSVRALSGDGRRWTIAAIVLSVVAVARSAASSSCAGAALALAAAVLWVAGPRSRRLRSGWSVVDHVGAAILVVGALIVLNAVLGPHSNEWATVTAELAGAPVAPRPRGRLGTRDRARSAARRSPGSPRSGCQSDATIHAGERSQRFSRRRSSRSGPTPASRRRTSRRSSGRTPKSGT